MSGHNKWSKIKRKKESLDGKKSKIFAKHGSLIANEVKKAGGDTNSHTVRAAVERAKADSMPADNIARALERGKGAGGEMTEVQFEAFGPGGTAMVVTALTDNNNRSVSEQSTTTNKDGRFSFGGQNRSVLLLAEHNGNALAVRDSLYINTRQQPPPVQVQYVLFSDRAI